MRLLFDQNLSFKLCALVSDLFPGSAHVRGIGLDQSDDRTLWDFAAANGYTIVTQDSDFADMASLFGPPPKVVWLRCGNQPTSVVCGLLRNHAQTISGFGKDETTGCLEIL